MHAILAPESARRAGDGVARAASRFLVGAVSHEVHNVCEAIVVIHENLVRDGLVSRNKDFEASGFDGHRTWSKR